VAKPLLQGEKGSSLNKKSPQQTRLEDDVKPRGKKNRTLYP